MSACSEEISGRADAKEVQNQQSSDAFVFRSSSRQSNFKLKQLVSLTQSSD